MINPIRVFKDKKVLIDLLNSDLLYFKAFAAASAFVLIFSSYKILKNLLKKKEIYQRNKYEQKKADTLEPD